nr:D-alanyl-D-alanine carboxypeptidase family protein [Clostridium sp. OF09-10]
MRKMNRIIPFALACAIFAAQPVQAATIIRDSDKQTTSQNTQTTTAGTQAGNEGGPGYENSTSNNTNSGNTQSQVSAAAKAAADSITKPEITSEAGILYDVTNGRVLFEKNADEKLAPASTTKLMTALLVLEKSKLDDKVTFSKTAVTNLESGAVKIGLVEGDQVSVKDCLYGLLLKSANEVANGLAEHVSGSISAFADLMNARAKELGCTNTHFVNPNGLNSDQQYTTCRDMAKIAAAAFANQTLCQIDSTLSYKFPATKAAAARTITPGHKMLYPNDSRYYAGIVGGKTGYTSKAGNTLVTCVEKDGVRMVAVILKSKSTHYADTKKMLDYGYQYVNTEKGNTTGNSTTTTAKQETAGKWVQDNGAGDMNSLMEQRLSERSIRSMPLISASTRTERW